jgi:hypothetical protein
MSMTPEERANYEHPDLARTLLVRLSIADPEQLNAIAPEDDKELLFHACDTTQGVNCAIRKVANALMQGELDTKRANTLLYALQSCLATIRIEQEAGPPRIPQLRLAEAEFTEDTPCTAPEPAATTAAPKSAEPTRRGKPRPPASPRTRTPSPSRRAATAALSTARTSSKPTASSNRTSTGARRPNASKPAKPSSRRLRRRP